MRIAPGPFIKVHKCYCDISAVFNYLWMKWFSSRYRQPNAISLAMCSSSSIVREEGWFCGNQIVRLLSHHTVSLPVTLTQDTHIHTHCTPQYTQAVINLTLPMHINLYLHISIWMCVYAQSPDRWKKCSPKHMYTHCTTHTTEALTALGRFCLRKLFMSPPVMSSRRINLGRIWRLTPIQRTMFWWLNLLQTHTGIFKYTSIYVIS